MHYAADYNSALGEVVAEFGLLEWNTIYAIALYAPAYVREAEYGKVMAGQIKSKLSTCISLATPADQGELTALLNRFSDAIDLRNDVLHGKPCTSPTGQQRLARHGSILELADLTDRITEFRNLSCDFNQYYHSRKI
jgi:hypothetical protein